MVAVIAAARLIFPAAFTESSSDLGRAAPIFGLDFGAGPARVATSPSFASVRALADAMEYSRHKEGDPDARGAKSMMEKHAQARHEAML